MTSTCLFEGRASCKPGRRPIWYEYSFVKANAKELSLPIIIIIITILVIKF